MKKVIALIYVIFITNPIANTVADSSNFRGEREVAAGIGLMAEKIPYTGPPNIPDPNVILQGGDTIGDATVIGSLPYSNTGTTAGYNNDYDEACPFPSTSPDVVYSFTPGEDMYINISLCDSDYDTKLYVYENNQYTVVGCNCDGCGLSIWRSLLFGVLLTTGNTYYIVVDGDGGSFGDYIIDVEEVSISPPANDDCVNAEPIGDVELQPFYTTLATASGLGNCMTSPDVWYVYTATCTARVFVTLFGSSYDTKLAIYDGNSCDPLPPEIQCDDDWGFYLQSTIGFDAVEGNEYLIQVGGAGGYAGGGQITIRGCMYPELCQEPVPPDGEFYAMDSDIEWGPPYVAYDNYPLIEQVCEVQFWGFDAFWTGGNYIDCVEDPMDFEIKFYPEDEETGGPDIDNPVCTYNVTPSRTGTGEFYTIGPFNPGELIEFNVTLDPCCELNKGWISVMGNTNNGDGCGFLWLAVLTGDVKGFWYQPPLIYQTWDFARCLEGELPNISIGMNPDNPPVTVPAGGSFTFTGTLQNNTGEQQTGDVWIMLELPGGAIYGPIQQFNNIMLAPNQGITAAGIEQDVPDFAPLGTYQYIARCGLYPSIIIDETSFEFTVIAPIDGGADNWTLSGWFDENENLLMGLPMNYALSFNYPNPFNLTTAIRYQLPVNDYVDLSVYNLLGQKVETLVDGFVEAGFHSVQWDASHYSSGIYFYKLTAGDKVFTKRMTLLK